MGTEPFDLTNACVACDPGKYAGTAGQLTCQTCTDGSFQNEPGQQACEKCPLGSYREFGLQFFSTGPGESERLRFALYPGSTQEQEFTFSPAEFGDRISNETNIKQDLVKAQPFDACSTLTNPADINGNIAFIDVPQSLQSDPTATCYVSDKVQNAMDAGAVAVVLASYGDFFFDLPRTTDFLYITTISVKSATSTAIQLLLAQSGVERIPALLGGGIAAEPTDCMPCPVSSYQEVAGAPCKQCPAGTSHNETGRTSRNACRSQILVRASGISR
jgi:hypothetical protein